MAVQVRLRAPLETLLLLSNSGVPSFLDEKEGLSGWLEALLQIRGREDFYFPFYFPEAGKFQPLEGWWGPPSIGQLARTSRSKEGKRNGGACFPASDISGLLLPAGFVERKKKQETRECSLFIRTS
ncbi:hypothetical protein P4E94_08670 [Pontiellaceae bacterium B12219]|nr:hypothetical protein [Pontiellaceae bacterium B12219]